MLNSGYRFEKIGHKVVDGIEQPFRYSKYTLKRNYGEQPLTGLQAKSLTYSVITNKDYDWKKDDTIILGNDRKLYSIIDVQEEPIKNDGTFVREELYNYILNLKG